MRRSADKASAGLRGLIGRDARRIRFARAAGLAVASGPCRCCWYCSQRSVARRRTVSAVSRTRDRAGRAIAGEEIGGGDARGQRERGAERAGLLALSASSSSPFQRSSRPSNASSPRFLMRESRSRIRSRARPLSPCISSSPSPRSSPSVSRRLRKRRRVLRPASGAARRPIPTPSAVPGKSSPGGPPAGGHRSRSRRHRICVGVSSSAPIAAAGRRHESVSQAPGAGHYRSGNLIQTNRSAGIRKHLAFHRALPKNAPREPCLCGQGHSEPPGGPGSRRGVAAGVGKQLPVLD